MNNPKILNKCEGDMEIMEQKEWIDRTHEIADRLESQANKKCSEQIEKAKAYYDGYIQGVEDYAREMRNNILNKKN